MFGSLNLGKSTTGQQNGAAESTSTVSDGRSMFSSQAAAALAAAAAANVSTKAEPTPRGRRLRGANITVDLDALRPGEMVPELQVQPITLLKFDYKLEHTQQVAITSSYICYGLKAGHIRALNRNTASRALFKGHPASLSHMCFFSPGTNLLASASREGDLAVRLVSDGQGPDGDTVPAETLLMRAQLLLTPAADAAADAAALDASGSSSSPLVCLAWHPTMPQILAAGAAGAVHIFEVPTAPSAAQPPAFVGPGIQYALPGSGSSRAAVSAVTFSPAGDLLVAADSAGSVHAWWLEGDGEEADAPLLTWQPFGSGAAATAADSSSAAVASVHFLHQAADGSSLLLTGDACNAALRLWALPPAAALSGASPRCLQAVCFVSSAHGPSDIFCHAVVQRELQLVVLANTVRKQVYTLHYSLSSGAGASVTAAPAAAFDYVAFFGVKQPILSLATGLEAVESQAVPGELQLQQLLLYTVQTDAIQQYFVSPALCSSSCEAGVAEPETVLQADGAPAAGEAAEADVEDGEEISSSITAPSAEPAAAAAAVPVVVPELAAAVLTDSAPAATAEAEGPIAAAVPPPAQLPTPGLLLHAKAAEQEVPAEAGVAEATPASEAAAEEPAMASNAAADADASKEADVISTAAAAALVDEGEKQQGATATTTADEAALTATAVPAALPPMPTTSLLHSAEKAPGAAVPPAVPAAVPAAAAGAESDAGEASAAATTAAAPAAAAAAADVAALQQQVQQLLAMQQDLAAQLQANSQQTVAGVKSELSRALKVSEASLAKQVEGSIKASAKRAEEERRKGAAKERVELAAQLEKLLAAQLGQVVTGLQRDLLKALADSAREQSRGTVTAVVNAVSPAVAQAVAASLQRELASSGAGGSGQLASVLERSLASSLAQPLHEALRENFAASIIPAFERATQVMFGQVESAFTSWLAESSRTVGAAQSDAAASLNGSLQQLQAVVAGMRGDLAETSRSLSHIASSTASRAAESSSAGGAGPRAASQLEAGTAAAAVAPADPRIEIGALLGVRKYEDALVKALNTASLDVLVWACKQVDPQVVLGGSSVGVSQTTLLSLVHQLSADLHNDANTPLKLAWLAEAAPVVDPHDPVTAPHIKAVLTRVMSALKALVNSLPQSEAMAKKGKITLHLFNSLLHQ